MTEFPRKFFKNDPVMGKLFDVIKRNHKVADHTAKVLYNNRHIKDFCEEARHFVLLPGEKPLYIHYDVASWYHPSGAAQVKIESIGVYDDFLEYEKARLGRITEGSTLN